MANIIRSKRVVVSSSLGGGGSTIVNQSADPDNITTVDNTNPLNPIIFTPSSTDQTTASNIGTGEDVFSAKVAEDLQFKRLQAGSNTSITSDEGSITISVPSIGEVNTSSNVGTGAGLLAKAKSGVNLPFKSINAGAGITVTNNTDDITISAASGGGGNMTVVTQTFNYPTVSSHVFSPSFTPKVVLVKFFDQAGMFSSEGVHQFSPAVSWCSVHDGQGTSSYNTNGSAPAVGVLMIKNQLDSIEFTAPVTAGISALSGNDFTFYIVDDDAEFYPGEGNLRVVLTIMG